MPDKCTHSFICATCHSQEMTKAEITAHLRDVHGITATDAFIKTMKTHFDCDDSYSTVYEYTRDDVTLNEYVVCEREANESINVDYCPICKSEQKFYIKFVEWYGAYSTCLNCGGMWMDGFSCGNNKTARKRNLEYAQERIKKMEEKDA